MCVKEQVARFLHIVGNDLRNTLSLGYIGARNPQRVESLYIQLPQGDVVSKEIQDKRRFFPYFKNYVGAIDGTHVCFKVPKRHALDTVAARFTYVLTGWEGTASDSRILKNALNRDDKLVIPNGHYYLVDAGLPHSTILMAPYRGVRYHLKEYSTRAPQNARELFNLRHTSLHNAIKRAFGVLKRKFPIIRSTQEPFYSCETQSDIFLVCCILHNFLIVGDRDKDLEDEVLQEVLSTPTEEVRHNSSGRREGNSMAEQLRNSIANQMWTNYLLNPNNEINMSI
uniref:DDE Tnp4 domain-containing protein n=1 Tax=Lactuca sativa TaxID=4236 RepID=A0A9R1XJI4_LACSA|nr:hypothetical protein LSAT_V11C300154530 [Lactuca sativa]